MNPMTRIALRAALLLAAGSLSAQTVIDTSSGHVALTNATVAPGDAWTKTGAGTLDARAATVAGILSHTAGNLLIGGGNIAPGGTLVLDGGDVTLARPFGLYEASAPAASWDIAKSAAFGYLRRTTNAVMAQRGATGWGDYIVYRYTGHWHVPADGPYSFLKDFDDAARLSIDGGVILENTEAAKTDALKSNVTLTEGWHDIELLFWNVTGQVGPRSTDPLHTSGLMWSSGASFNINTAKSFFLSDNLDLIADGAPNRFDGNVVLKQSAALTVPADAGSFGGFASLTLDPAAAPGTVLTVTTGSGAPIPVGAAAPVWAVFADDIPAAYPDGIVFTNRVWLASAPPANAAIADGAELALDGPALLGPGDIALAGHAVHITRPDSVGGTVTADTALEHIAFNTARLTGGTVTDHATNLFAAANNAVISGGASVRFTGAGTNLYTGAITGTGDIIKEGSGVTVLTGEGAPDPAAPQTLSGTLLIHNNILQLASEAALHGASTVIITNSASAYLSNIPGQPLDLTHTTVRQNAGGLHAFGAPVTLDTYVRDVSGPFTITGDAAGSVTLAGTSPNLNIYPVVRNITLNLAKTGPTNAYAVANLYGIDNNAIVRITGGSGNQIDGNVTNFVTGVLDLNGHDEGIATLHGTGGTVRNDGPALAALTIGERNAPSSYSGALADGASPLALTKTGSAAAAINGASASLTGPTAVEAGILRITSDTPFPENIVFRLDAADPATFDLNAEGRVTRWRAVEGTAVFLADTSAGRYVPAFSPDGLNGRPALFFDGTDDAVMARYTNSVAVATPNARTVFIVYRTAPAVPNLAGVIGTSGQDKGMRLAANGDWRNDTDYQGNYRVDAVTTVTSSNATLHVASVVLNADRPVNAIGHYWGASNPERTFRGHIGEIIAYDIPLTAAQVKSVERTLIQKWNPAPAAPLFRLDASASATLTTNAAGRVTAVADAGGSGLAFTSANTPVAGVAGQEPLLAADPDTGAPALHFPDDANRYRLAALSAPSARAFAVVYRQTAMRDNCDGLFGQNNSDQGLRISALGAWRADNNGYINNNGNNAKRIDYNATTLGFSANAVHILVSNMRGDLTLPVTALGDYANGCVDQNSGKVRCFRGYLYELVCYDTLLTPAQMADITSALAAKWRPDLSLEGLPSAFGSGPASVAPGATLAIAGHTALSALSGAGSLTAYGDKNALADLSAFTGILAGSGSLALTQTLPLPPAFTLGSPALTLRNDTPAGITLSPKDGALRVSLADGASAFAVSQASGDALYAGTAAAYTGPTELAGGTARVVPPALPVTKGLNYRLDASDRASLTLDPDGRVDAWRDAALGGITFAATNAAFRPLYAASAINGLPAVRFDGATSQLKADRNTAAQTVFLVLLPQQPMPRLGGVWGSNLGQDVGVRINTAANGTSYGNDNFQSGSNSRSVNGAPDTAFTYTAPHQYTSVRASGAASGFAALGYYWHGQDASETTHRYWNGYVGEVLCYSRALADSERAAVEAWLMAKWGVTPAAAAPASAPFASNVFADGSATTLDAALSLEHVAETLGALSGSGSVALRAAELGINAFQNAAFSGNVTGAGTLTKTGPATQTLAGNLAFAGGITVAEGTLDLDGATLDGVTNILVKSGATLAGHAAAAGNLAVIFEPGSFYAGTLNVNGALNVMGQPTLALPAGAAYPHTRTLFIFGSLAAAARDAILAFLPPSDLPAGLTARVTFPDVATAKWSAAASGTLFLLE
jgi:autotransporter-associated beta strand protein